MTTPFRRRWYWTSNGGAFAQRWETRLRPMLDEIAPRGGGNRSVDSEWLQKLKTLRGPARTAALAGMIQGELGDILASDTPPDPDTPLTEFGLDSLMAVEFSGRLQQRLGDDFAIAPTIFYDYPTIQAITGYLLEMTDGLEASAEPDTPEAATVRAPSADDTDDDIAVIGMGCRFPGAANLAQYWSNLLNGVDAVRDIPADRWDMAAYYDPDGAAGKMYVREGGFLDRIREFDAAFFNISDLEACWLDPQHRLMLEVSWEALEDAGVAMRTGFDPAVGVFMGIMSQDYGELLGAADARCIESFEGAGLSHSAGVGRVSHAFGFEGPCLAIDTASSSSLVAICQAVRSLQQGACRMALAGGVNAILTPTNSLLLSKAGMLARDGRCKSFSSASDGLRTWRRMRRRRAQEETRRRAGRGSRTGRDPRNRDQPQRSQRQRHDAQRARPGAFDSRRLGRREDAAVRHPVLRSARNRNRIGRSDRDPSRGVGAGQRTGAGPTAARGFGQSQHCASRSRRRRFRLYQGGDGAAPRSPAAADSLRPT